MKILKSKITEEHLKKDIPLMIAKLKVIEYLYGSINPSCLKASTIDKFSKESYKIHGLLQDIEDELFFEKLHQKTKVVKELGEISKMLIDTVIDSIAKTDGVNHG